MSVKVRPAEEADLPAILGIVNEVIRTSTANYKYEPETLAERQAWLQQQHNAGMPVLAAEWGGQCVGFGTYGQFREKIGYRFTVEHSVYVAEGYQSQGIGRALLAALIEQARAQGLHSMIAGIDADNTGSIEFHQKFGFVEVGRFPQIGYKFERWLDVVFLQLVL